VGIRERAAFPRHTHAEKVLEERDEYSADKLSCARSARGVSPSWLSLVAQPGKDQADPRGGVLPNNVLNRWYRELSEEAGDQRQLFLRPEKVIDVDQAGVRRTTDP
jgi:hypothetical protein